MSAYVVLILNDVHGLNWLTDYQSFVPPLVEAFGGEYIAMSHGFDGNSIHCVDGSARVPAAIGIMRFPSVAAIKKFFESDSYRPYRKMRIAETDGAAFAFEG